MILHPIIDLLKRIVIALPDYAGGGGELPESMNHIGSGEIIFASRTNSTTPIYHGLNFTPKYVLCWTSTQVDDSDILYGSLTRHLVNVTGSTTSTRDMWRQYNSPSGVGNAPYAADNDDEFITSTTFTIGHSYYWYKAATPYYWFAFD